MTTFTTQDRIDAQRTPLSYNDIMTLWWSLDPAPKSAEFCFEFARAIERAHGIGDTYHQMED
jgi:hypothetical protein